MLLKYVFIRYIESLIHRLVKLESGWTVVINLKLSLLKQLALSY